jgi:hypothetical protein
MQADIQNDKVVVTMTPMNFSRHIFMTQTLISLIRAHAQALCQRPAT